MRLDVDAQCHVRESTAADGSVVLLVHGLGSTAAAWIPVVRHAPADVGLLIPELPGFGTNPSGEETPLEAATDLLVELLQRYPERTPTTVVAHSVGAIAALQALQLVGGGGVDRLVLVSGTLLSATHVLATPRSATADVALTAMVGMHVLAGAIPLNAWGAHLISRHRSLRSALLWPFLSSPGEVPEDELLAALPHPGGRESMRAVWSARHVDLRALMEVTDTPTLILHGEADRLIPESDVDLARTLLDPEAVIVLEGCGHWPHIERPAQTAAAAFTE